MSAPTVEFPFFPHVKSPKGEKLVQAYRESHCTPIIAHQLCALQIFQARITRSRYCRPSIAPFRAYVHNASRPETIVAWGSN